MEIGARLLSLIDSQVGPGDLCFLPGPPGAALEIKVTPLNPCPRTGPITVSSRVVPGERAAGQRLASKALAG